MLAVDHVQYASSDLARERDRWRDRFGLAAVEGGRHLAHGTENLIVPLGREYIELIGVFDAETAKRSIFGRWVMAAAERGGGWLGWCLRTDDINGVSKRLGLPCAAMERQRPDGMVLSWRLVALERAIARPSLPFFIQWDVPDPKHPARSRVEHVIAPRRVSCVQLAGDPQELKSWIADESVPLEIIPGDSGVAAVTITTVTGEEITVS